MYNFVTKKDLLTQKETSPGSDNYGVVITRKKERKKEWGIEKESRVNLNEETTMIT